MRSVRFRWLRFFGTVGTGSREEYIRRITDAAMASHTPINVFMDMSISMFNEFVHAIHTVIQARNKK